MANNTNSEEIDGSMNTVLFNFFLDMRKKDIDKKQRATLLAKYMKDNNLTSRGLAAKLGISKSTILDWLLINRISKKKYETLKVNGMTDTSIYRMLRNNIKSNEDEFDLLLFKSEIKKSLTRYSALIKNAEHIDGDLYKDIKELINILNRALIHNDRNL